MVALFVILFVVTLLTIDLVIQIRHKKYPLMSPVLKAQGAASDVVRMPKGIFFHPAHTWARMSGGDDVVVGVDDFIQKALGTIENVTLPFIGQKVNQGDPVITLSRGGRALSLVAPVSGTVIAINRDVIDNPALIDANPYDEGWLFSVAPDQLAANLSVMSIAESAVTWIRNEAARFREFLHVKAMQPAFAGETMLDGGVAVAGSLEHLDTEALQSFEQEFLR